MSGFGNPIGPVTSGVAEAATLSEVAGHSLAFGVDATGLNGYARRLARALNVPCYNRAVSGAVLVSDQQGPVQGDGWCKILRDLSAFRTAGVAPYLPASSVFHLHVGLNDLAYTANIAAIKAATRTVLSYVRAAASGSFATDDASIVYGAGWSSAAATLFNTGAAVEFTATEGAHFDHTLPATFPGGVVGYRLPVGDGWGAVYTATSGSMSPVSTDTRALTAAITDKAPNINCETLRVTLPPGAQVVRVTVTSISEFAYFDGAHIEAPDPPVVLLYQQNRCLPAGYALYSATPLVPSDATVDALNAALSDLAAEFDGCVRLVDLESAFQKNPALFSTDQLHYNDLGHATVAAVALKALLTTPESALRGLAEVRAPRWVPLTLAAGVAQAAGFTIPPACRLDENDELYFRGVMTDTPGRAAGAAFASLPSGCAPAGSCAPIAFIGTGVTTLGVAASGDLASGSVIGAGGTIILDGVHSSSSPI